MANPYLVPVGTYVSGGGLAQSGWLTFTFANTAGFDALVPFRITNPGTVNISAGGEVWVYRSADGAVWETEGTLGTVFTRPTAAGQVQIADVPLSTGIYRIAVQIGGGSASTWTAEQLTAQLVTAYA